jgi:hypothetical protein
MCYAIVSEVRQQGLTENSGTLASRSKLLLAYVVFNYTYLRVPSESHESYRRYSGTKRVLEGNLSDSHTADILLNMIKYQCRQC